MVGLEMGFVNNTCTTGTTLVESQVSDDAFMAKRVSANGHIGGGYKVQANGTLDVVAVHRYYMNCHP